MLTSKRPTKSLLLLLAIALLLCSFGCGSEPHDRNPSFLDSAAEKRAKDAERLSNLQMLRVWAEEGSGGNGEWLDLESNDLNTRVLEYCAWKFGSLQTNAGVCSQGGIFGRRGQCPPGGDENGECTCDQRACSMLRDICSANTLMELATTRSGPYRMEWYYAPDPLNPQNIVFRAMEVPPQSLAANASMLRKAMDSAKSGLYWAARTLTFEGPNCQHSSNNQEGGLLSARRIEANNPEPQVLGAVFTHSFMEAYYLYKEATDKAIDAIVSVADWQRSHPSLDVQIERAIEGAQLSRAEAIHLLIGGDPGLPESATVPGGSVGLCSAPELSSQAQRALALFREAALPPALMNSQSYAVQHLLGTAFNGDVASVGTIADRMRALGKLEATAPGEELLDLLDITYSDMAEARAYMIDEFRAYSRSLSELNKLPNMPSEYEWWASIATPPPQREAPYYSAIGRFTNTPRSYAEAFKLEEANDIREADYYTDVIDMALSMADTVLGMDYPGFAGDDLEAIVESLTKITSDGNRERTARWAICTQSDDSWLVSMVGYGPSDDLILVSGEEGLECGVQGTVEGVKCNLDDWIVRTMSAPITLDPPRPSFKIGVNGEPPPGQFGTFGNLYPDRTVYLLAPKGSEFSHVPTAGQYKALSGMHVPLPPSSGYVCNREAIVPGVEERIAEILRPSKTWCSQSSVSCAGEVFDARLPLENELSDDLSGVENSWRTYLELAKQAAAEADLLGEQYVSLGLELDRREEEIELREHAQEVAVMQELENLQSLCGTAVDLDPLVNYTPTPIDEGDDCTNDFDCGAGTMCLGSSCVPDLEYRINVLASRDPEYRRLQQCLSPNFDIPFVTPGDRPLKGWVINGDPNTFCRGVQIDESTGQVYYGGPLDANGNPIPCPVLEGHSLAMPEDIPANPMTGLAAQDFSEIEVTTTLDYFASDYQPVPSDYTQVCDKFRQLRITHDPVLLEEIKATNVFHPRFLEAVAGYLGFEPRLGGFSAVTFNGSPLYETGRFSGIVGQSCASDPCPSGYFCRNNQCELDGWPCNPDSRPASCGSDTTSLFCSNYRCDASPDGVPWTNERLRNAVIALRLSLGMNLQGIAFPFFIAPNYHQVVGIPEPTSFERAGPGNVLITDYTYEDESGTFPTIRRQAVDANVVNGWCWGPYTGFCGGGAPAGWYGWSPAEGYDFATAEWGDLMLERYVEQRRVGHVSSNIIEAGFCGLFGCDDDIDYFVGAWSEVFGPFDGNWWSWADMTRDSIHYVSSRAPAWFDTAQTPSLGWSSSTRNQNERSWLQIVGVLAKYLSNQPSFAWAIEDDLNPYTGASPDNVRRRFNQFGLAERGFSVGLDNILDGAELACAAGALAASEVTCTSLTAPEIRSAADLKKGSQHLECMARSIQAQLGRNVFAHFPAQAVDALKNESAVGSFPLAGGDYGTAISALRGALVELADVTPQIMSEVRSMANDIDAVRVAIERHEVAKEIAAVEFQSLVSDRLTQCAVAASEAAGLTTAIEWGRASAAAATCANSFYQIHLGSKLESLKQKDAELASEQAIIDFDSRFANRAQTLERLGSRANAAVEQLNAQLSNIENLRLKATRSLNRAIYMDSFEAENQMAINNVMRRRFNTSLIRYENAFKNARRLAFIAKRAIEQRLGIHLANMHEDLPLVDPPSSWEADVCSTQGIDYNRLAGVSNEPQNPDDPQTANFAEAYIGDYVRNLENLVESYRMVHNFHEGLDTAVISLKDDVYRSRTSCEIHSNNLLYYSGTLDSSQRDPASEVGWSVEGCAEADGVSLPSCLDVRVIDEPATDTVARGSQPPPGYRVTFGPGHPGTGDPAQCVGCGLTADTRLAQALELTGGPYTISWYSRQVNDGSEVPAVDPDGSESLAVFLSDGSPAPIVSATATVDEGAWQRHHFTFSVPTTQVVQIAIVPSALGGDPNVPHQVEIGAPMLEFERSAPSLFEDTDADRTMLDESCPDQSGDVFRSQFQRRCLRLCADGFDGSCSSDEAVLHCFYEANFNLNQRDIESGRQLGNTGFALGNFNYRIEAVGINFVGTAVRDCTDADSPTNCYSHGFIPYSIRHQGPYFVRNHLGQDFRAHLFAGNIEHARGLATERYITNPVSSADRELLESYTRKEFQGRPLDGNFTIRIWDDEGVDFSRIRDVQLILDYRYWTRFD